MHGEKDLIVPQDMSFRLIQIREPAITYFPENDNHMMEFDKNLKFKITQFIQHLK
jgi:hypothetical protein